MGTLFDPGIFSVVGLAGEVLPGASLAWYVAGTATPAVTYADAALTVPNPNPAPVGNDGRIPAIWLREGIQYKLVLLDADGVTLETREPISSVDFSASNGSSRIGFQQSGEGARAMSVQEDGRLTLNAAQFLPDNYVTDGSVDYTVQLQKAVDEAIASGRELRLPAGDFRITGDGLNLTTPNDKPLIVRGQGIKRTYIKNMAGTAIRVGGQFLALADVDIWAKGGPTVRQAASFSQSEFERVSLVQLDDGHHVWDNAGFEYVDVRVTYSYLQHTTTSTVHAVNLVGFGGTINDNIWEHCRCQNSGTKHFFNVDTTSANAQYGNTWEGITWEVCLGGGIRLRAANRFLIDICKNWDADTSPIVNDFYDIGASYGIASIGRVRDCIRLAGGMGVGKFDVKLQPIAGNGVVIEGCENVSGGDFFKIDAGNNGVLVIGFAGLVSVVNTDGLTMFDTGLGKVMTYGGFYIDGLKVVGEQGAALPDLTPIAGAPTSGQFNDLQSYVNALVQRLRDHGLIAS